MKEYIVIGPPDFIWIKPSAVEIKTLPAGMSDRLFSSWYCWDRIKNCNGREAFIAAFGTWEEADQSLLAPLPSFANESEVVN